MTLNAEQRRAVDSRAELRLILAGPGSGKTRTLLEIARSAKVGSRVVMMTFTNAAANEFRTRLMAENDTDHLELRQLAYCGTLHGYCFRVIQRFGGILGYIPGKVGILPEGERKPRLSAARAMLGKKRLSDDKLLNDVRLSGMELADRELVHAQYRFDLKRSNMVDYDGILSTARDLLMMPEVKAEMQIHLLLVDEYQDSAFIDQTIYEEVPAQQKVYAGDVDQSIYEFRGANPSGFVILAGSVFANSLTDAEGFKLELNYRSDIEICDAANKLIAHNKNRVEKTIVPAPGKPETPRNKVGIQVSHFDNVRDELQWISQHIAVGPDWTTGVLFRRRYEVKMCRDYLRMMGLPVHVPKFEARPPDWDRSLTLIGLEVCPNDVLVERYLRMCGHSPAQIEQWKGESAVMGSEFIAVASIKVPVPMDLPRYLAMGGVSESTINLIKGRMANLEPYADLADLLNDLHSYEETPEDCNKDGGIYVGTMHSAKGREWDAVFLPAFEQQVIPGRIAATFAEMGREPVSQQLKAMSDLEEERRLAFVAVTRARHELYITHVDVRQGEWVLTQCEPSQFICEMGL